MAFTFITTLSLLLPIAGAQENWWKTHPNDDDVFPQRLCDCLLRTSYKDQVKKMPKEVQEELTCNQLFDGVEGAQRCRSDASKCCPDNCFREFVCSKDYPRNAGDTPKDSAYTEFTYHLEYKFIWSERPWYLKWSMLYSYQRVKYNSCNKVKNDYHDRNPWLKILCAGDDLYAGAEIKKSYQCTMMERIIYSIPFKK